MELLPWFPGKSPSPASGAFFFFPSGSNSGSEGIPFLLDPIKDFFLAQEGFNFFFQGKAFFFWVPGSVPMVQIFLIS
eukprot:UN06674